MILSFRTRKLQKICSKTTEAQKALGAKMASKLQQRLMELQAANCLADISRLPPARCHPLAGNRTGQLSIDLIHPYRLLFIPANNPKPELEDGGLDWSKVTEIEIIKIEDTHS